MSSSYNSIPEKEKLNETVGKFKKKWEKDMK